MDNTISDLMKNLDTLIAVHKREDDMWVDFFQNSKDKILRDPAFGCAFLATAWTGIGGYDDDTKVGNQEDEALRLNIHNKVYDLASKVMHDKN